MAAIPYTFLAFLGGACAVLFHFRTEVAQNKFPDQNGDSLSEEFLQLYCNVDDLSAVSRLEIQVDSVMQNIETIGIHLPTLQHLRLAESSIISLRDAHGLLATVEAYMVLCGRSDLISPSNAARTVAGLGLLGLALQVARAYQLDLWEFVFRPFTQLCVELETCTEDKALSLAQAAQGPAQAYMFVSSDGNEPLGCQGSLSKAFWATLEEGLRVASELQAGDSESCVASSARLHTLVAHEVLTVRPEDALPDFLVKALSTGPSWIGLLRLYMRHSRTKEAVDLLVDELKLCQERLELSDSLALSKLSQFPISLAVQLRAGIQELSGKQMSDDNPKLLVTLDTILTQLECLLEDSENRAF